MYHSRHLYAKILSTFDVLVAHSGRVTRDIFKRVWLSAVKENSNFDYLLKIVTKAPSRDVKIYHYNKLLLLCPDWGTAQTVYRDLTKRKLVPQTETFHNMIKRLCKFKGSKEAFSAILKEADKYQVPLSRSSVMIGIEHFDYQPSTELLISLRIPRRRRKKKR